MPTAISRLTSAYIACHIILNALTTVDILHLITLSKPTSNNPVHMSAYSVAMASKG